MKKILLLITIFGFLTSSYSFAQEEIRQNFSIKNVSSLSLDNYKGNIYIESWDKPGAEISVKIYCEDDHGNCEKKISRTKVLIDSSSSHLKIETDYSKVKGNNSWLNMGNWFGNDVLPSVDYTIKMPANATLAIDDYKSYITLANLKAQIKVETYKGKVKAAGISGPLKFESYKGESEFSYASFTGDNSFETYKGDIRIYVPENTKAAVDKDLTKRADFHSEIQFTDSDNAANKLHFESYKGSIQVKKSRQ
jgi:DUF4097 and DUF4098 domain-containing protein YvlB